MRPRLLLIAVLLVAGCASTQPTASRFSRVSTDWSGAKHEESGLLGTDYVDHVDLPLDAEGASTLLLRTRTFGATRVGIAGSPTMQYRAFIGLRDEPDADALFDDLLARAHPPGQLYALCHIQMSDPQRLPEAAKVLPPNVTILAFLGGCMGEGIDPREFFETEIASGQLPQEFHAAADSVR